MSCTDLISGAFCGNCPTGYFGDGHNCTEDEVDYDDYYYDEDESYEYEYLEVRNVD